MLGFRGASRYIDKTFSDCFALECEAIRRGARKNGHEQCLADGALCAHRIRSRYGYRAVGRNGITREEWTVIMMCEVPSNAILAAEFLQRFDGFSIGSNDLTQMTLALDRDSEIIAVFLMSATPPSRK